MSMDSRFLYYVQMLDSALPIGGFSHSFGLETYVQEGRITNLNQLKAYLISQLQSSLIPLEGLAIRGLYQSLVEHDEMTFWNYDQVLHVQRTAKESRQGVQKMGKRLFALAKSLYPWLEFEAFEAAMKERGVGTLPTIHTWISYQLGIQCQDTVTGYMYNNIVTLTNSALRLMSLGQTEGQILIRSMIPIIEEEWRKVAEFPPEQLFSFAVAQEIRAMNHETLYSRLFMS